MFAIVAECDTSIVRGRTVHILVFVVSLCTRMVVEYINNFWKRGTDFVLLLFCMYHTYIFGWMVTVIKVANGGEHYRV